jgi:NADH:ubiquinone oxidoreductase subunit F (NADH-binding)
MSGPSGGFLPRQIPAKTIGSRFLKNKNWQDRETIDVLDLPLDISAMRDAGLFMGAGMVVYNSEADMLEQAYVCSRFYAKESCGKCVPCRLGSAKTRDIADMFRRGEVSKQEASDYTTYALDLASAMTATSICGLGQVASMPLLTLLQYFPEIVDAKLS